MERSFKLKGDLVIWVLVVIFAMVSILAVFSSSTYRANAMGVEKTVIFFEQIKYVLLGFATLFVAYLIPMRWYRGLSFIFFGISVAMLVMTFIPSFQVNMNGAIRGIKIFGISFQVFEFAKVGLVLYLAKAIEYWQDSLDTFKDFALKLLLPVGAVCLLVMANSFSSAILFGLISLLIMWFMGVKMRFLLITIGAVAAAVMLLFLVYNAFYASKPETAGEEHGIEKIFNRVGTVQHRFESFFAKDNGEEEENLTPQQMQARKDYIRQSENAKVAISQGGLIGKGPGKSTQRFSLSMAFSDFIYAFIVEEYGLLGGILVLMLYTIFLFRCIRIANKCETPFAEALVTGLAFLIGIQAMLHIFVNVRLIPITGHTLPLISHGGTAFMVLSGAFGIILSVSKQLDRQTAAKEAAKAGTETKEK
ncbi:MAG: FtsW/RodA/SpoVE family cell cycle protein [Bacteroidales bacterium]|nr:FtsW/RodA/SpoVE family cell cycle protein [Bacteroidales bacterium]MBR5056715.1 FtsW/RodA/SpoVE family cell cycle protein [Bacteroidales bacterium]